MAREERSETSAVIPMVVGAVGLVLGLVLGITQGQPLQQTAITAFGLGILGFLVGFVIAKVGAVMRRRREE